MARTSVTIEGGDELLRKLREMGLDVSKALEAAARAGAQVIADAANPLAPEPVVVIETEKATKNRVTVNVGIPDKKWYLKFFETGVQTHEIPGPLTLEWEGEVHVVGGATHPGMAARPFLRPAYDTKAAQGDSSPAVQAVGEKFRRTVEDHAT